MKIWNYRTYKGRRFYRLNHAEYSKSKFFLSYYRILHTAYLQGETPCISTVNRMFEETFGSEPNTWSVSYITKTESCFVNDTIVESLTQGGKFNCPDSLRQILIEIGFDVYLMQSMETKKKPNRKDFYRWLPLKKEHRLKKLVNNFWKERIPKEKLLSGLGYQLESYKNEILSIYRKLLLENDILVMPTIETDAVLSYISSSLENFNFQKPESEDVVAPILDMQEETAPILDVQEEVAVTTEELQSKQSEDNSLSQEGTEPEKEEIKPIPKMVQMTAVTYTKIPKKAKAPVTEGRGFSEKNKMTRKKAVTCAVCVAAAGALLVPLVAYSVIKHKA